MASRAIKSLHNVSVDRCVDIIKHDDGTFGFKEFRRDPEDRGGWTLLSYNPGRRNRRWPLPELLPSGYAMSSREEMHLR